jgi:hypothetical protein
MVRKHFRAGMSLTALSLISQSCSLISKGIVENPVGTIKLSMDHDYFLMNGIPKTSAEMYLSFLAYNIKRVINILGVPKMIEALG